MAKTNRKQKNAVQDDQGKQTDIEADKGEQTARTEGSNVVTLERGLSKDKASNIMADIRALEQPRDDAAMELAGYYKRLKEKGGHDTDVIRLVRRLSKMEQSKRDSFLAQLDIWRDMLGFNDQGNLFAVSRGGSYADQAAQVAQNATGNPNGGTAEGTPAPISDNPDEPIPDAAIVATPDSPGGQAPMFN